MYNPFYILDSDLDSEAEKLAEKERKYEEAFEKYLIEQFKKGGK